MKKLQEASFQKKLTTNLREQGWHPTKLQSGMGYTVLDLYLTHPTHGGYWVELKTIATRKTKVGVTPLQAKEMRDLNLHGSPAICLVALQENRTEYLFILEEGQTHVDQPIAIRKFGESWDGDAIGREFYFTAARLGVRPSARKSQRDARSTDSVH